MRTRLRRPISSRSSESGPRYTGFLGRWPSESTTSPSSSVTVTAVTRAECGGDAADADSLRTNVASLPGFGEMKIKALGSVLAKRFGIEAAQDLVPWHPTLGDVDSPQALADYQAAKKVHKSTWTKSASR